MVQRFLARVVLILFMFSLATPASAGVVIEQEFKGPSPGESGRLILYVEPGRLRMESQTPEGQTIMIFRADRQVVWMIQPSEKSYHEMSQTEMDRMKAQMDAMLKNLPPDQRAMAEQMMKGRTGASKPANISVKRLGSETVGKYSATKYEVFSDGQRTTELWTAPLEQVSVQQAEYDTFLQFGRFMEKLSQAMAAAAGSSDVMTRYAETVEGFPVKAVNYTAAGKPVGEHQVVRAERQAVGDDKFQVPAGFRKVQMPGPEP